MSHEAWKRDCIGRQYETERRMGWHNVDVIKKAKMKKPVAVRAACSQGFILGMPALGSQWSSRKAWIDMFLCLYSWCRRKICLSVSTRSPSPWCIAS
jgi:hypothetical protein